MAALSNWPNVTDDPGDKRTGTKFEKSLTDAIKASINAELGSAGNPGIHVNDIIDEVIAARGSKASLTARLDVSLNADGTLKNSSTSSVTVGTAGENLSAGDVCYLADGTGGTTAGRWHKADADFTYASSEAVVIGIAQSAILINIAGQITLSGLITGYVGLTAGATYYVSATAGALTVTAPANSRVVGRAQSTTTLVINPPYPVLATATVPGIVSNTTQVFKGPWTIQQGFTAPPMGVSTYARLTSNFTKNNSTTLSDVTGLSFAIGANEVWEGQFILHCISTNTSNISFTLTGPAAATGLRFGLGSFNNLAAPSSSAAFGTRIVRGGTSAGGLDDTIIISFQIRNGANAGTVQLQMAQNTAEVFNTIIYAESHLRALRIS